MSMKKKMCLLGGILLAAACVLLAVPLLLGRRAEAEEAAVRAALREQNAALTGDVQNPEVSSAEISSAELSPSDEAAYLSPVDFEALWAMNSDIYAWLEIPGTDISYPVLRREGDDSFYLSHDSAGGSGSEGSIFTETAYNGAEFTDPVTVVYGHNMRSGEMFGSLQAAYSASEGLDDFGVIMVYLPDRELCYQVFAAVPYSRAHILYYHDFDNPAVYQAFLDEVLSTRSIDAHVREGVRLSSEDRMLILSTCLQGDRNRRYLVLAELTGGTPDISE